MNSGLEAVQRMVLPMTVISRSITTDNWFPSIPLAETLRTNHNLILVETIKKKQKKNSYSISLKIDQYKELYSVSRMDILWPLTLFFTILNDIGLNSFIIYKHAKGDFKMQRHAYLKELNRTLCLLHLGHSQED